LSSIPSVTTLCFGSETADNLAILNAAKLLNDEPKEISAKIKALTATGMSYAKARAGAWKDIFPESLLSSPNNILAIEYTRAILSFNSNIDILPILRIGNGYNEDTLSENYSSASAIRLAISKKENFKNNLPDFVVKDIPSHIENTLETLEKYTILSSSSEKIAAVCDCTEGLENALKKAAESADGLVDSLTSARYTSSRIRRIALQNLLNIEETLIR
jgi:predicted nucleotidyltransferase